jgi:hypothetical protein
VAGSTMSARTAVSVMNCSCTQVKRSLRPRPSRQSLVSGQTAAGLVFWTSSAVTGGPPPRSWGSPVMTGPKRDWSNTRTELSRRSRPSIRVLSRW